MKLQVSIQKWIQSVSPLTKRKGSPLQVPHLPNSSSTLNIIKLQWLTNPCKEIPSWNNVPARYLSSHDTFNTSCIYELYIQIKQKLRYTQKHHFLLVPPNDVWSQLYVMTMFHVDTVKSHSFKTPFSFTRQRGIYLSKMPTATWFPWNMDKNLNRYPWPDTFEQRNDNCWKTSTPCNKPKKTNIQKLTLLNLKMDPETRRRNHLPNIPNLPFWGSTCWFSEM